MKRPFILRRRSAELLDLMTPLTTVLWNVKHLLGLAGCSMRTKQRPAFRGQRRDVRATYIAFGWSPMNLCMAAHILVRPL